MKKIYLSNLVVYGIKVWNTNTKWLSNPYHSIGVSLGGVSGNVSGMVRDIYA